MRFSQKVLRRRQRAEHRLKWEAEAGAALNVLADDPKEEIRSVALHKARAVHEAALAHSRASVASWGESPYDLAGRGGLSRAPGQPRLGG